MRDEGQTECHAPEAMSVSTSLRKLLATFGALAVLGGEGFAAEYFDETKATTLFAFDQVSIPYSQNLRLEMRAPARHPANPVLTRGEPGSPDAMGVQFYGSVIHEGGRYRMWYVAYDDDTANKVASSRWRPAYAESPDGLHWTKPNLGLVEFRGSKNNNLIQIDPAPLGMINLKVLSEPDDSNPERRYKMSTHVYFRRSRRLGTLAPFVSADGLSWKMLADAKPVKAELAEKDLVLPAVHFEPCGGLYRWDGMYYICGQNALNAPLPYQGRVTRLYRSPDFAHWSQTSNVSFVREPQHVVLGPGRSLEGEQCHEGISVWNRRNVLLGLVGFWHGAKEWKDITIDLGFVISNDGLHFREPVEERVFLKRGEDDEWDQGGVIQGQGFENIGDQTFIYYGTWDPRESAAPRGGVGIATLLRDRFGDLVVKEAGKGKGDYQLPVITSEFITTALSMADSKTHRFFVNADGLGPEAALRIELLDEKEMPVAGYSGQDAAVIRENGFQSPITWKRRSEVGNLPARIHLRVVFEGKSNTNIRFSALYVQPAS
jgi:hypothetical protein